MGRLKGELGAAEEQERTRAAEVTELETEVRRELSYAGSVWVSFKRQQVTCLGPSDEGASMMRRNRIWQTGGGWVFSRPMQSGA